MRKVDSIMAKQTTGNKIDNITAAEMPVIDAEQVDAASVDNVTAAEMPESANVDNAEKVDAASVDNSKAAKLPKMPLSLDRMAFIGGLVKSFADNSGKYADKFGGHYLTAEQMKRVEFWGDKIYSFVENCGVWGLIVDTDGKTRSTTAIIPYNGQNVALTMPHNTGKKPLPELVAAKFQGEDTYGYKTDYLRKIGGYIRDDKALVALITFNHMIDNNFSFPAAFYTREDARLLEREYPAILDYFAEGIDTKADVQLSYQEVKQYFDYRAKLNDIILDGNKSDNQRTAAKALLKKIA